MKLSFISPTLMIPSAVWVDANFYSHQSHFTPTQFFPNLSNISSKVIEKRDILNQLFLSTLMTNEMSNLLP